MIVKELVDVCCPEEVQVIESRQVDPVEALQVGQSFGQPRHVLHDKQKEIVTHAHKLKKGYLKVKSNSLSSQSFKKIKAQKRASDFFSFLSLPSHQLSPAPKFIMSIEGYTSYSSCRMMTKKLLSCFYIYCTI